MLDLCETGKKESGVDITLNGKVLKKAQSKFLNSQQQLLKVFLCPKGWLEHLTSFVLAKLVVNIEVGKLKFICLLCCIYILDTCCELFSSEIFPHSQNLYPDSCHAGLTQAKP